MLEMDIKNSRNKERRQIALNLIVFLFLVFLVVSAYSYFKYEKQLLINHGVTTTGIVTDTFRSKKGTKFKYKFWVNNTEYTGGTSTYNDIYIGERYIVIYYL